MNEIEILNYYQLAFVANAIYCLTFAALIFITFRLIRFQREKNANTFGKVLVTIFGLCTVFFGYNVFSYLYNAQLAQSYRLSELLSNGAEISEVTKSYIDFTGFTVANGWPPTFIPEPAALVFIITFAVMVVAGVWVNLSKD
tara:strand:+ start:93 stop:518 length:426 start_codon:yes stop_codon:yes gene_type:complete